MSMPAVIRRTGLFAILLLFAVPAVGSAQKKSERKPNPPSRSAPSRARPAPSRPHARAPRHETRRTRPRPAPKRTPAARANRHDRRETARSTSRIDRNDRSRAAARRRAIAAHDSRSRLSRTNGFSARAARFDEPELPIRRMRPVPYVELVPRARTTTLLRTDRPTLPGVTDHGAMVRARPMGEPENGDGRDGDGLLRASDGRRTAPEVRRPFPPPVIQPPIVQPPIDSPPDPEPPETPPSEPPPDLGDGLGNGASFGGLLWRLRLVDRRINARCNGYGYRLGWSGQPRLDALWYASVSSPSALYDRYRFGACSDPFEFVVPVYPNYDRVDECAEVKVEAYDETVQRFTVALPALDAGTAAALDEAIDTQLERGMPVFLWDADGNEIRLDPETVKDVEVERCDS